MSESAIQNQTRLLMAQMFNSAMYRNNVGAGKIVDNYGVERQIRWGLANDSAQLNKVIKSSDLIGITPMVIGPHHIGRTVGVFTALELKHEGWTFPNETNKKEYERACAQQKFIDIVRNAGGFAGFVSQPHDIFGIIKL